MKRPFVPSLIFVSLSSCFDNSRSSRIHTTVVKASDTTARTLNGNYTESTVTLFGDSSYKLTIHLVDTANDFMSDILNDFPVTNRQTFIEFLDLLRQDFLNNPESWENNKMESFLEALSAYASDIQGYYDNTNQNIDANKPSWQTFADIFRGAKIYE